MSTHYSISAVAKQTNLSISTLRYYEDLGLIQPKRSETNYRLFTDADLTWLAFIKRLKALDMPLKQIVHYSNLRKLGATTLDERMEMLAEQEERLIQKQVALAEHLLFLKEKKATYLLLKEQLANQ